MISKAREEKKRKIEISNQNPDFTSADPTDQEDDDDYSDEYEEEEETPKKKVEPVKKEELK